MILLPLLDSLAMTSEELLEKFLELHPTCRVCGQESETVRQNHNPHWGQDPANNFNPRTEIDDWLTEVDPGDVVGVCWEHLKTARAGNGGWHEPESGSKAPRANNWMTKNKEKRNQVRAQLIEKLGGKCFSCREDAPYAEMRIRTSGASRQELDITSREEWYRFLLDKPALLERTSLFCLNCQVTDSRTSSRTKSGRDAVLDAYGGKCWNPSCDKTEGLMVLAKEGTQTLRWPNGTKYTSTEKIRYLVRHGFPQGWVLSCASHQYR